MEEPVKELPKVRLFDIESDGLLPYSCIPGLGFTPITKVHCIVIHDYHRNWYHRYGPDQIDKALEELADSDVLVAHNGIKYDLPALEHVLGWKFPKERVLDTLVLSRLIYPNIKDMDNALMRKGILPGKLYGSHSLKAWGYRVGESKGDFGEQENAWEVFTPEMLDYCEQDVKVTRLVFDKLMMNQHYMGNDDLNTVTDMMGTGWINAVKLEHDVAFLLAKQERNGFPFDEKGAQSLYATLAARRQELTEKTIERFGSWYAPKGGNAAFRHPRTGVPLPKYPMVKYPKKGSLYNADNKTLSKLPYFEGAPYTPLELVVFNPGSRQHIAKVLQKAGWVPTEFTETGLPKIDEETLADSAKWLKPEDQEVVLLIAEYLTLVKRLGQIAEGDNAWLKLCHNGFVHGSVNPNGAVTGRATHSFPNVGQVPAKDKLYGPECRDMWGVKHMPKAQHRLWPEAVQVGTDASGLELRCLAHFMAKYDGGSYIKELLGGDIHWQNTLALGLVPAGTVKNKEKGDKEKGIPPSAEYLLHDGFRNMAKTFIYAFLYGAGDEKIGSITGGGKDAGKKLKKNFMEATPAIAALRAAIESALVESSQWSNGKQVVKWKRTWMKGLDGRKLHVRSPHSALNMLLQSAGALLCKFWIVATERILLGQGFKHGWDGDFAFMAWVHDELQIACKNQVVADAVKAASQAAIREAGEFFQWRCVLDADSNQGQTWLDCH